MKNLLQKIGIGASCLLAGIGLAYGVMVPREKKNNKTTIHFDTEYPGGKMKTHVWIYDDDSFKSIEIKAEDVTLFEEKYPVDSRNQSFQRDIREKDIPLEGTRDGRGFCLNVTVTDQNGNYSAASKWFEFLREKEKKLLSKYEDIERERKDVAKLKERLKGFIDAKTYTRHK
jgi:hypothetical protein